jgi:hypothetical protein
MKTFTIKYLSIIVIAILAINCVGNSKKGSNTIELSSDFQQFLSHFNKVDLPITIYHCSSDADENLYHFAKKEYEYIDTEFRSAYAQIPTNGDYIAIITLAPAECMLPILTTLSFDGKIIDETQLAVGGGADCGFIDNMSVTIAADFSIYVCDSTISYDCDSIGEEIKDTRSEYVLYQEGKLLTNGKIELSKEKKKYFINQNFIGEDLYSAEDFKNEHKDELVFNNIDKLKFKTADGKFEFNIKIDDIKSFQNDPGDFYKIGITKSRFFNNQKNTSPEVVFSNIDGWVFPSNSIFNAEIAKNNNLLANNYFLIQKMSDEDYLLFAFGYPYASSAGALTIINLTHFAEPTLIFNGLYDLAEIKDLNNDGITDIIVDQQVEDKTGQAETIAVPVKYYFKYGYFHKKPM